MRLTWKHYAKVLKQKVIYTLICFMITLTLLFVGALLFYYIEHCYDSVDLKLEPHELAYIDICKMVVETHSNHTNDTRHSTTSNQTSTAKPSTHDSIDEAIVTRLYGICTSYNLPDTTRRCELNWKTAFEWFDYTSSVTFTTGFGRMVPRSDLGKIMTVVYALPSIALGMSLYLSAGHIVTAFTQMSVLFFYNELRNKKLDKKAFTIHVFILETVLTLIVWMIFSVISMHAAQTQVHTFLDGFYFASMTLSTVGFGDFSYSSYTLVQTNVMLFVAHAMFFCIGTGALASIISSINELIEGGSISIPVCWRQKKIDTKDDTPNLGDMMKGVHQNILIPDRDANNNAGAHLQDKTESGEEVTTVDTSTTGVDNKNGSKTGDLGSTNTVVAETEPYKTSSSTEKHTENVGIGSPLRNAFDNTAFTEVDCGGQDEVYNKKYNKLITTS